MVKIEDKLGRRFEKLRISLLNSCNFSCVYCVSEEPVEFSDHKTCWNQMNTASSR